MGERIGQAWFTISKQCVERHHMPKELIEVICKKRLDEIFHSYVDKIPPISTIAN